jgi:mannosyltransferase
VETVTGTAPTVGVTLASGRQTALREWAWRLAPVLAGLVALLLNVILLGHRSLRFEEAQGLAATRGSWGDLWSAVRGHEAPHALVDVALKGWVSVAGDDEWSLRLPAAVAGAVAVGLVCLLATRMYGRVAGLVAAGVLATNAAVLAWSQTARSESFLLATVVLATLALVAAVERPTWWRVSLWGLAAVLAVAISPLALPVLVAHTVAFAVRRPREALRSAWVAAGVAAVAAVVSVVLVATSDAGSIAGGLPPVEELGLGLWQLAGWSPVPLAVGAYGLFALITRRVDGAETWTTVLLGAWLALPVAAGLLVAVARASFDPRYALTATPALALLAAAGVVAQRGRIEAALVAVLAVGAAVTLVAWYAGPSEEDWRAAIDAVEAEQQPGDAVVVLPDRQRIAAAYYAGEGYVVDRPHGHMVWLLLAETDAERRLELGRRLVDPPRYALLEERRYGDRLWLQVWAEP